MEDWREILRREHSGEDAGFLFQLRRGPGWDKEVFRNLVVAMRDCCKALDSKDDIPRWIADLFWYLDWYVRQEIDARYGDRDAVPEYYENAWTNLHHLAHWLFTGEARSGADFEPMEPH